MTLRGERDEWQEQGAAVWLTGVCVGEDTCKCCLGLLLCMSEIESKAVS